MKINLFKYERVYDDKYISYQIQLLKKNYSMVDFYQARQLVEKECQVFDFLNYSEQVQGQNSSYIPFQPLEEQSRLFDNSPSPTKKANKEEPTTSHSEGKETLCDSDLEIDYHEEELAPSKVSTHDIMDAHQQLMEPEESLTPDEEYSVQPKVRKAKGKTSKKTKGNTSKKSRKRKPVSKSKPEKPHPIKNFLPAFRGFIAKYLREKIESACFTRISSLKEITAEPNVTKQMFENLFKDKEMRRVLKEYFERRFAYRDLMLSRIGQNVKKQYVKRIVALEKAFVTESFKSII